MKRTLAIGCAAVALTTVSGAAFAQTKFDVLVGGDYQFKGAYLDEDNDDGFRSTEFRNRLRLNITPKAKADNGLEYGARLRLRAMNNGSIDNDRAFLFVNGGFGTVQLGTINGLSDEYGVIGPVVDGISGSPDDSAIAFAYDATAPNDLPVVADNFRNQQSGSAYTRINYLTPTFGGFQAGVSYAAQADKGTTITRTHGNPEDIVELGGAYSGEFSGFTVAASGYYEFGDYTAPATENLSSWTVGLSVGFGPAAIGGFYADQGDSGFTDGDKQKVWGVNGSYTIGPIILAASYMGAKEDLAGIHDLDYDQYEVGVTYTVAPGLTTGIEYNYYDVDGTTLVPGKSVGNGSIVMWDTRLAF